MDDTTSRLGTWAIALILATGTTGCVAPTPGQPTLLGWLGIGTPAQILNNNANSDNAAIAQAAKIKQQKCLQCKKIKAIKYLATIGCGCYDKDGGVSKALLAALSDCDDKVRTAAIQAIIKTASGCPCETCGSVSCCKKDVVEQLAKMAYEVDDKGCWIEPSEKIRKLAAKAAEICCPCQWPQNEMGPSTPVQEPDNPELKREPAAVEGTTETPPLPVQPKPGDEAAHRRIVRDRAIAVVSSQANSLNADEIPDAPAIAQTAVGASNEKADEDAPGRAYIRSDEATVVVYRNLAVSVSSDRWPTDGAGETGRQTRLPRMVTRRAALDGTVRGIVRYVDQFHGLAHVEFGGTARIAPGTRVIVEHQALFGKLSTSGILEVVASEPGSATVKALGNYQISRVASGDQVFVSQGNS
jgi:hypothetical protein